MSADVLPLEEFDFLPSLEGRLANLGKLKRWEMAVAELVQNSIDSLSDAKEAGSIEIHLTREPKLLTDGGVNPIQAVEVRDTGPGFNSQNFQSFCTPDSTRKQQRGGKGIGRFTCLLVFDKMTVDSCFQEDHAWQNRRAELTVKSKPKTALGKLTREETSSSKTVVRIEGMHPSHLAASQVSVSKVAEWLKEHFLPLLIDKPEWLTSIKLFSEDEEVGSIDLIKLVEGRESWKGSFTVGDIEFKAVCHSLTNDDGGDDKVRLVAAHRVVNSNTNGLSFYLPHLGNVTDQGGSVVLVYSDFFDQHVNSLRNAVSFEADGKDLDDPEPRLGSVMEPLTAASFRENFRIFLLTQLSERAESENVIFRKEISRIVDKAQPSYRSLLEGFWESPHFQRLKRGSSEGDVLQALDVYKRKDTEKMKRLSKRLAKMKKTSEGYDDQARELASQIDTQKQVALAEYVSLRKIILDRLESVLDKQNEGHSREEEVHNLLFPMRTNSELSSEIPHQLWILDERLEAHSYLSSDQPIDGVKGDRPDLLLALDRPSAFGTEGRGADRYDPIVLVELKRPLVDLETCPTDKLPHKQLMRYAEQIENGKAKHHHSKRPFYSTESTRFYLYAVCEMSPSFTDRLERMEGFTLSMTKDGAFKTENRGKWYVEYISLGKLLSDARLRNSSFFRKLGLE